MLGHNKKSYGRDIPQVDVSAICLDADQSQINGSLSNVLSAIGWDNILKDDYVPASFYPQKSFVNWPRRYSHGLQERLANARLNVQIPHGTPDLIGLILGIRFKSGPCDQLWLVKGVERYGSFHSLCIQRISLRFSIEELKSLDVNWPNSDSDVKRLLVLNDGRSVKSRQEIFLIHPLPDPDSLFATVPRVIVREKFSFIRLDPPIRFNGYALLKFVQPSAEEGDESSISP